MKYMFACVVLAVFALHPSIARSDEVPNTMNVLHIAVEAPHGVPVDDPKPAPKTERLPIAFVTGFNTVDTQTDSVPCEAAGGKICGRSDVVACPRTIPLHTWVSIAGKAYECMDRTAKKYNGRFDISCDKDTSCPYEVTGWYRIKIL